MILILIRSHYIDFIVVSYTFFRVKKVALTISNLDVLDLTQPVEAALHPLQQGRPAQGTFPQFYN